jgi:hypothetical protein
VYEELEWRDEGYTKEHGEEAEEMELLISRVGVRL